MATNTLLTIDMITREALRIAHEKATFIGTINRSYDDQFAKTGAKIGDTLRIRNPNQYTRRQGSRVMSVQDQKETSQTLTVATQDGVDMGFYGSELALKLDDFSERYIEPAMAGLVSAIDGDMIAQATKDTYNWVGTPGTIPGTVTSGFSDTTALGLARAKLNQGLAPKDGNRSLQMDSVTMASVSNGIKGLFLPQAEIERAFREGYIAHTAMCDIYENERTWTLTNIADVVGTTDATGLGTANADGSYSLVDIHTTVVSPPVGASFTIAGVYACHPETKQSTGALQNFVVTTTSAGGAITVSPTIYLSGAKQNVCTSASVALVAADFNSKTLTFEGNASTSYRQSLMYHKDAFTFVTADLPIMENELKCVRRNQDGISLRVWQGSDITNDQMLMRIDILYGFKTIRPAWSCRITN